MRSKFSSVRLFFRVWTIHNIMEKRLRIQSKTSLLNIYVPSRQLRARACICVCVCVCVCVSACVCASLPGEGTKPFSRHRHKLGAIYWEYPSTRLSQLLMSMYFIVQIPWHIQAGFYGKKSRKENAIKYKKEHVFIGNY